MRRRRCLSPLSVAFLKSSREEPPRGLEWFWWTLMLLLMFLPVFFSVCQELTDAVRDRVTNVGTRVELRLETRALGD